MALNFNLLNTNMPAEAATSATKGMQQVNALTAQRLENQAVNMQMQNALAEQEAFRNARTPEEAQQNLMRGGFGKSAMAIGQNLAAQETARAQAIKYQADAEKLRSETMAKTQSLVSQMYRDLSRNPSDANIVANFEDFESSGYFTPQQINSAKIKRDQLLSMPIQQRSAYLASQGASASDLKPTVKDTDYGGGILTRAIDPYSGAPTTVSNINKTMTPGEIAVDNRARQNLAIANARFERDGRIGTIPAGYRLSPDGQSLELMPGGPTAIALPPKEIQKREATFPQATSAVKAIETKSDSFIKDLETLRNHPGLSEITGLIQGRLPALTGNGRAAEALYDKIVAKGGFQALQDLRDASKTGGALGSVSDREGKQLIASFAAIDRRQNAKDVQFAIDQAIDDVKGTKTRVREAFDDTYSYRDNVGVARRPVTPNAPVQIKSDKDYNALPSGTEFVDPDGNTRRKP